MTGRHHAAAVSRRVRTPPRPEPEARSLTRSQYASVARHGLVNLAGAVVSAVLNLAFTVLVTRTFTRHEAGVFFSATSVFLLGYTVSRLGTGTSLVYFISRHRSNGHPERIRASLRIATVPVLIVALVVAAGLFAFAPEISQHILRGGGLEATAPLRVLALFVPFAAISDLSLAAARGFGRMRPLVVVEKVARPLLQVALLLLVVGAGESWRVALPAAWGGPYVPAALVAWLWLDTFRVATETRSGVRPAPVTRAHAAELWRFTAPRALGSIAQIGLQRLDIVLVGALAGPTHAAVYTAATRFLVFGQLGATAISTAVQHRFGELLAVGDRVGTNQLYQLATSWLVLLMWPMYLLFAVFSHVVLSLFGHGYEVGRPVMILLALTMLISTGTGAVDNVLNMAGRTLWTLANAVLALAVDVVLDLLLIPRYGILGAAIGWSAAIVANNVIPLTQLAWAMRLHPFGRGTFTAAGLAAGCFGIVPLAALVMFGDRLPILLAAAAVGAVAYAAGLWRFQHTLEFDALRALRRQASRR